jgi:hypothetical protein
MVPNPPAHSLDPFKIIPMRTGKCYLLVQSPSISLLPISAYGSIQTTVFEDLAQEAVSICKQSLVTASENISMNHSKWDGQLFLIKHLLILKEQLAPFEANLVHAGKELDFSHVNGKISAVSPQHTRLCAFDPLFQM